MNNNVLSKLEAARGQLLDPGMRNPLLNHHKGGNQVEVVNEASTEVYRLLVREGKKLAFDSSREYTGPAEQTQQDGFPDSPTSLTQPEEPRDGSDTGGPHADGRLQTSTSASRLQARLLSIHRNARTYREEQGVDTLFLALGFLHWYESPAARQARRAPLLLVPVDLNRSSVQQRFQIAWNGDDVGDNLPLQEKLRAEFGLELACLGDTESFDPGKYFARVERSLQKAASWRIEPNEIILGFFSFGNFLMYRDLNPAFWTGAAAPARNSILEALFGDGFSEPRGPIGEDDQGDNSLSPTNASLVIDADRSQTLAILDIERGRDLALQGPPGTGKSQTITNVIADAIAGNRKVLFVANKVAALETVKRRLEQAGLGEAVLELHGHKSRRKAVLAELERTLARAHSHPKEPEVDTETLAGLRDRLNGYCEAVTSAIGDSGQTFVSALGRAAATADPEAAGPAFETEPMAGWADGQYRQARRLIKVLDGHLAEAGPPNRNPFRNSGLTAFLSEDGPAMATTLQQARKAAEALEERAGRLAETLGLQRPATRGDAETLCAAVGRVANAPSLEGVDVRSPHWRPRYQDLHRLFTAGKRLGALHAQYDECLIHDAWEQDLLPARAQFVRKASKWWRFLSPSFRKARAKIQRLCRRRGELEPADALRLIDAILDAQANRRTYDELSGLGRSLFGAQWLGEKSDWATLAELTDWLAGLHGEKAQGLVPAWVFDLFPLRLKRYQLHQALKDLESLLHQHAATARTVVERLALKLRGPAQIDWGTTLDNQIRYLDYWLAHLDDLVPLARFNSLAEELRKEGLDFVLDRATDRNKGKGTLVRAFDHAWLSALLERACREHEIIRDFDLSQHEHCLEEFRRLDRLLLLQNRTRIAREHRRRIPDPEEGGEMAVIMREINKRRHHLPVRALLADAGNAVQAIKPVFMATPISVARFLPPGGRAFDLVVFDESSRIRTVDALGAILRAGQAMVVGDDRQLPPADNFGTMREGQAEQGDEAGGDEQSILDLFVEKGALQRRLRWHYRSRHESLIAVSNQELYGNHLLIFPSPRANYRARGLRLHHLPETACEPVGPGCNPKEARAVAEAIMDHARKHPDLTLGVAALSVAQCEAIETHLESARRADPDCEHFFAEDAAEPFFLKTLENVQGDERDVIIISLGHGRTAQGHLPLHFGPLEAEYGERRLNVLISRARLAMDVFSNLTASDLDLQRTDSRGVAALRSFLAFAESGTIGIPGTGRREPVPPFEKAVLRALTAHGLQVRPRVGSAGLHIDIAVADPDRPGQFTLGIECDSAICHGASSARDRDRLRGEVLHRLGWRIHRVWSAAWYRNRERELNRALAAVERARQKIESPPALS